VRIERWTAHESESRDVLDASAAAGGSVIDTADSGQPGEPSTQLNLIRPTRGLKDQRTELSVMNQTIPATRRVPPPVEDGAPMGAGRKKGDP
jgi:hypothetical protein